MIEQPLLGWNVVGNGEAGVTEGQRGHQKRAESAVGTWTRNGIGTFYSPCVIAAFGLWEAVETIANTLTGSNIEQIVAQQTISQRPETPPTNPPANS